MPADFLTKILKHKQSLLKEKKAFFESLKKKIKDDKLSRYRIFKQAITQPNQVSLIAEIKKASPSQGIICKDFNVNRIAATYLEAGASAISVLTEEKFFLGKVPYMRQVSEHFKIPVLAKDFFIDEVQIYEAFYFGASAILLIVALLDDKTLKRLIGVASNLDIDCLVEVHNETELKRALQCGAEIIGVNNRNLHTLTVSFDVSRKLIPMIPKDKIIVSESGIKSHEEIKILRDLGVHAVLIGETFLRAEDMPAKIREVMHGK